MSRFGSPFAVVALLAISVGCASAPQTSGRAANAALKGTKTLTVDREDGYVLTATPAFITSASTGPVCAGTMAIFFHSGDEAIIVDVRIIPTEGMTFDSMPRTCEEAEKRFPSLDEGLLAKYDSKTENFVWPCLNNGQTVAVYARLLVASNQTFGFGGKKDIIFWMTYDQDSLVEVNAKKMNEWRERSRSTAAPSTPTPPATPSTPTPAVPPTTEVTAKKDVAPPTESPKTPKPASRVIQEEAPSESPAAPVEHEHIAPAGGTQVNAESEAKESSQPKKDESMPKLGVGG